MILTKPEKFAYCLLFVNHRIYNSHLLLIGLLLILPLCAPAAPRQSLVPGGVAIIALDGETEPQYRFRGKPVLISEIDGVTSAVIGLPINLEPGEYHIESSAGSRVHKRYFEVVGKQYTTQYITIENDRKVNPYASDMKRILAEKKRKQKINWKRLTLMSISCCPSRAPTPAATVAGVFSTVSRAALTVVWTSPPIPAPRCKTPAMAR